MIIVMILIIIIIIIIIQSLPRIPPGQWYDMYAMCYLLLEVHLGLYVNAILGV